MQIKTRIKFNQRTRQIMIMAAILAMALIIVMPAAASPQLLTASFDLYAVTGSTVLPDQTVTVWGYNSSNTAVTQPGGPTLIVNEGDTVEITLHNEIGEDTALIIHGQDMIPDLTGVPDGGSKLYTFTAGQPGTYLYEAGLLPNAQHQVAMGLYGVLIVRPDPAFAAASGTFDTDYANAVLADSPAHYYRLGEAAGPTAFDAGTSVSPGTYGTAVTLPVPGLPANTADTAAGFDGTADSYVDTGVTSQSGGAFSIEAWVNANTIGTAGHRIVAKDEVGATGAWILWFNAGKLRFQVRDSSNTSWVIVEAPTTPSAGTAFHVVGVFDGTDVILYLDGVEVARTALGTAATNTNSLPITIGADSDPLNPRDHIFDGTIDEVALYEVALAPTRIQAHYIVANAVPSYTTVVNADSPAHYYRLGEAAGPTAFDAGTSVSNGTYGTAVTLPVPGLLANNADTAAGFDGTADSYVDTGVTSQSGGAFAIEAWVNANTIGTTGHRIVAKDEVGVTGAWLLWFNAGKLRFQVRDSSDTIWAIAEAPTTPPAGTTFHVVGVFDGADAVLHLDGVEVARTALGTAATSTNSLPITIGADSDPLNPRDHIFDGTIDEVALYEVAPAPARIQAHYAAGNASLGTILVDSTADFTTFNNLVGGTLYNDTDGSSCTISALTATTLTCAAPLAGGAANTWAPGDAYTASGNFAYSSMASNYDDEAVLLLSEIDPALNTSVDPAAFDMRHYKPTYWLINGQAYPDTQPIPTSAGNKVLLRYVNAGLQHHTMSLMGLDQMLLAEDGYLLPYQRSVVAETIMVGQTRDMIVDMPATIPDGSQIALYNSNMLLHNNNAAGFGGMMTFITTAAAPAGPDTEGPTTSAVTVAPSLTDGTVDVSLSATVSDVTTGNNNITAAEYFIDDANGVPGTGVTMSGAFASPTENVSATILAATVAGLSPGDHTIYVRGLDDFGNWGSFNIVTLRIELSGSGPTTKSLTLTHNPTAGDVDVLLSGTADDSATGNSNIVDAEFWVGAPGADGSGTHMAINVPAPIASIDYTIPAATFTAEGVYTINVHSQDDFLLWGPMETIDLEIDLTGPDTSSVVVAPNPNNGTLPINPSLFAARLDATISDPVSSLVQSDIYQAEFFINDTCNDGTGIPMYAEDGVFDSPTEDAYALISLININALGPGSHTISVHGRDNSGNWGACTDTTLVIDQGLPTVTGTSATPNPTAGATSVSLTAVGSDGASTIDAAEWFVDADPGPGNGTPMTLTPNGGNWDLAASIDVSTWTVGNYTLYVRVHDIAGNWSATDSVVLDVTSAAAAYGVSINPTADATSGTPGSTVTYILNVTNDGNIIDTFDVAVAGNAWTTTAPLTVGPLAGGATGQISVDVTIPGTAVTGDSDAATVTVTSQGDNGQTAVSTLTTSTVADLLYFSTANDFAVPGTGGTPDDADIYSWDGTAFSRIFDGSAAGLPGNADIDAMKVIDADTIYMSFTEDGLNLIAGQDPIQDEDIVLYDAGTWSLYLDGSELGLNSNNGEDVDAFEILPDGSILLSAIGLFNTDPQFPSNMQDEDIVQCVPAGPAPITSCTTINVYFDGSDAGFSDSNGEDINGVAFSNGTIYLSTVNGFSVAGLSGGRADVIACNGPTTGTATSCASFSMYFDGSVEGIIDRIDAIDLP